MSTKKSSEQNFEVQQEELQSSNRHSVTEAEAGVVQAKNNDEVGAESVSSADGVSEQTTLTDTKISKPKPFEDIPTNDASIQDSQENSVPDGSGTETQPTDAIGGGNGIEAQLSGSTGDGSGTASRRVCSVTESHQNDSSSQFLGVRTASVGDKFTESLEDFGNEESPLLGAVGGKESPLLDAVGGQESPLLGAVGGKEAPLLGAVGGKESPLLGAVSGKESPLLGAVGGTRRRNSSDSINDLDSNSGDRNKAAGASSNKASPENGVSNNPAIAHGDDLIERLEILDETDEQEEEPRRYNHRFGNFAYVFNYLGLLSKRIIDSREYQIFQLTLLILPISEIIMGANYFYSCPGIGNLPLYELLMGITGVGYLAGSLALDLQNHLHECIARVLILVSLALFLPMFFFIMDNTFNSSPSFDPSSTDYYCDMVFYYYAYCSNCILIVIVVLVASLFGIIHFSNVFDDVPYEQF